MITFTHEKGCLKMVDPYQPWVNAELRVSSYADIEPAMEKLTTIFLSKCLGKDLGNA